MPKSIDAALVRKIVDELLISFKQLPGFNTAVIRGLHPIYDLNGKDVAYYEVEFTSPQGNDNGYAIVSATEDDLPVVEFSHTGKTHYKRFRAKLSGKKFKMVWFGPTYITAESPRGKFLTGIGVRPTVELKALKVRYPRGEGSTFRKSTIKNIKPKKVDVSTLKRAPRISYRKLKSTYKRPKITKAKLREHWKVAKSPHSPCTFKYYWAKGCGSNTYNGTYYLQIPKKTSPNNTDHSSGCGPTAWMNLYGWHDLNQTSALLEGRRETNNAYIKRLTMALHDYLDTFAWPTSDQGFTWPDDMEGGLLWPESNLNHQCSYWYRHDWSWTDEEWVFRVAKDAARKNRPFIVGYFEDWHYALGYGIAECTKHGWKKHSWIRINPAWAPPDSSQDKWIPMGTIFGIYAVYDFWRNPTGSLGPVVESKDWSSAWTSVEFFKVGSATYLFLLKKSGSGKNVKIFKMNANGSVGTKVDEKNWSSGWTTANFFEVGSTTYLFILKKSGTGSGGKNVKIFKMNADGSVGTKVDEKKWSTGWSAAEFYKVGNSTYLIIVKSSFPITWVKIYKMNTNGTVGENIATTSWMFGNWHAKPFKPGNKSFMFTMNQVGGLVSVYGIN